jgi:hypothetical protein
VLGSLLWALLNERIPPDDARTVLSIVTAYGLIRDRSATEVLAGGYMLPVAPLNLTPAAYNYGPDFKWQGPDDGAIELQGLFHKEPEWLDVGFLRRALESSSAVCRIEIGKPKGTGFLISPNLVLTNYHVLKFTAGDDMAANAAKAVLRFGCFSTSQDEADVGRIVNVSSVVDQSPVNELDYVLLRTATDLAGDKAIRPASLLPGTPKADSSLNIIHHPGGDVMKVSMSGNAITGAYPDSGLMQYVTAAAEGSSGSPCFNNDWKVVGIHHAQRARSFGSIREGIMIEPIYERIKQYL